MTPGAISSIRAAFNRLKSMFTGARDDAALDADIRAHLDLLVGDYVKRGLSSTEAEAAARRAFGGVQRVFEQHREQRRLAVLDRAAGDLRHAIRTLRRSPTFAVTTILTLALGIGATTAIVSAVDAVLLRPLPYPEPDRVLALSSRRSILNSSHSGEIFHHLKDRVQSLAPIAASRSGYGWNLVAGDEAIYVTGMAISANYFGTFGVTAESGREFVDAEDLPNGPRAVILSQRISRRLSASSGGSSLLGQMITLGGTPHIVVGIMPAAFRSIPDVEIWTPLALSPRDSTFNYEIVGRLRSGSSLTAARAELEALKPALVGEVAQARAQGFAQRLQQLAWLPYQQVASRGSRYPLLFLLGAAAFVLLVTSANLAGLQIVRTISRRREMATRAALGGGSGRAISQMLTESVLLSAAGGAGGVLLGVGLLRAVLPFVGDAALIGQDVRLDWRVLTTVAVAAFSMSVLIGLWPAVYLMRLNIRDVLCGETDRTSGSPRTTALRRALVLVEVAIACILLTGAGLFGRELIEMSRANSGFEANGVVIAQMSLQSAETPGGEPVAAFLARAIARIREIPGVESAAATMSLPVARSWNLPIEPAGRIPAMRSIDWQWVTPEYFSVFRVPLEAGRALTDRDGAGASQVAVVNAAFARAYFGDPAAAVGRVIQLARALNDPPREIVGVVGDTRAASNAGWSVGHPLAVPATPTVYFAAGQVLSPLLSRVTSSISWVVRADAGANLVPSLTHAMRDVAPRLPVIQFTTMDWIVGDAAALQRAFLALLGAFALLALTQVTVGIYGLIAYGVANRTKEIGIRLALGARPRAIIRSLLREGVLLAATGVLLGLAAIASLANAMTSTYFEFLFGVRPVDTVTFSAVAIVIMLVAGVAGVLPARRVTHVDPATTLRN